MAEPKDRISRDVIVALFSTTGAEDFGALLYDLEKSIKGKDLDETAYTHAVAAALGFSDGDDAAPSPAKFFFRVYAAGQATMDRAALLKFVASIGSLALAAHFQGATAVTEKSPVVQSIVTSVLGGKDVVDADAFASFVQRECPRLLSGAAKWVEIQGLGSNGAEVPDDAPSWSVRSSIVGVMGSDLGRTNILSRELLWLLSASVPDAYLAAGAWTPLYNSVAHGHGANRFFHHVLHYKGPTVVLVRGDDGEVIAACVDSEWKVDEGAFGGANCKLLTMAPIISHYAHPVKVNADLKTRHTAHGIAIGGNPDYHRAMLWLFSDLGFGIIRCDPALAIGTTRKFEIGTVEVWGCGPQEASARQTYERHRDLQLAEQMQKVRLPESWAESPDRFILGLAGISVDQHSRIAAQTR